MQQAANTIQPSATSLDTFEEQYIALRKKEKWLCTDEELKLLPQVPRSHPHFREWRIREQSSRSLLRYLQKKGSGLRILEVGCGNGWFSHKLAGLPDSNVTGTDINLTELQQAKRVFAEQQNLEFLQQDIRGNNRSAIRYDIIVFAASIQYFPWLNEVVHAAFDLLAPGGEIHITDSPLYNVAARKNAAARSAVYFEKIGFPEMSQHYFHHVLEDMEHFQHTILYDPQAWYRQLLPGTKNPFYWIRINND